MIFEMNLNEEVLFRYFYRKWMAIFDQFISWDITACF